MAASLAKRLRGITSYDDEERFDLASYTEEQVKSLVPLAFSAPIVCAEPLRLTFIVGGGKLVRHRYDESLPKWLGAALREAGFADDRGAALGDAKVFKLQVNLSN